MWRDSTSDLARGLDVIELTVDISTLDSPEAKTARVPQPVKG